MKLSILYRGPLSSCNYGCEYCPFAKHRETGAEHAEDGRALERFLDWVEASGEEIGVFFTPWGEALVRRRYQRALVRLTQMSNVWRAAIQTNGSCRFDWVEACDKAKLGLWITYHPGETTRSEFLRRCGELLTRGIRFSVGVVGLREHFEEIAAVRAALPSVYVWVNAYKREPGYYAPEEVGFLASVDPLFPFNNQYHPSLGRACATGESVFSVDGEGTMRRCHFVKSPIGNIYEPEWRDALSPRPCVNERCGCHIGYVHMPHLGLDRTFGAGILERVPLGGQDSRLVP